jgi:hypothetical protein
MILTNKNNLPEIFMQAVNVYQKKYESGKTGKMTVSEIIKPVYMRKLEKQFDSVIEEDVSDRIWTLFGQALHEVLSKCKIDNTLTEERMSIDVDGIKVSGQVDIYFQSEILQDYKTTSVWKMVYKDFDDWISQLNIYKYILEKNGFPVKKIEVIAILKDWSKSKALQGGNYPDSNIKVIGLPIIPDIETYIKDRVKLHIDAENIDIEKISVCNEKERWYKGTKFAVMKKGNKKASKVFDDEQSALTMVAESGSNYFVENRPGENIRCENYCNCNLYCPFYKNLNKEVHNEN